MRHLSVHKYSLLFCFVVLPPLLAGCCARFYCAFNGVCPNRQSSGTAQKRAAPYFYVERLQSGNMKVGNVSSSDFHNCGKSTVKIERQVWSET